MVQLRPAPVHYALFSHTDFSNILGISIIVRKQDGNTENPFQYHHKNSFYLSWSFPAIYRHHSRASILHQNYRIIANRSLFNAPKTDKCHKTSMNHRNQIEINENQCKTQLSMDHDAARAKLGTNYADHSLTIFRIHSIILNIL